MYLNCTLLSPGNFYLAFICDKGSLTAVRRFSSSVYAFVCFRSLARAFRDTPEEDTENQQVH